MQGPVNQSELPPRLPGAPLIHTKSRGIQPMRSSEESTQSRTSPLSRAMAVADFSLITCHASAIAQGTQPPPAVTVIPVASREVTDTPESIGRVVAINKVHIVARVPGFIEERSPPILGGRESRVDGGVSSCIRCRHRLPAVGKYDHNIILVQLVQVGFADVGPTY
jgi:hypothetical protein